MTVHNVVQNPAFTLTPHPAPSSSPFTGGQAALQSQRRQQEIQKLFDAFAGNNQLRSVLAQRFAEMEQQNVRTRNLDKIQAAAGPSGALDMAGGVTGLQANRFSQALDPVQLFRERAEAQKVASEATLAGAKAGPTPIQSPQDFGLTGFTGQERIPLGTQSALAGGSGATLTTFINGSKLEIPFTMIGDAAGGLIGAAVARARGQPISVSGIQTTPQKARADAFIEKAGRNNPGKAYFPTMREDGVIIIHEHNQTTGETKEVQYFDAQGISVAE